MLRRRKKQLLKARLKAKVAEKQHKKRKKVAQSTVSIQEPKAVKGGEAWSALGLHDIIVRSLVDKLGFNTPTEIQQKAIPPAINGKHDIIGAAETVLYINYIMILCLILLLLILLLFSVVVIIRDLVRR